MGRLAQLKPHWVSWSDVTIIVVLMAAVLAVRTPIAAERKIMPAGDAFNFQHIASHISVFSYPLHEKRLPTYPFFILIGRRLGFDPIQTSIGISLAASAGTVGTLYLLGRRFKLHRPALVALLGLSIFDPLLVVNAVRPLADSLFIFLMMFTILLATIALSNRTAPPNRLLLGLGMVATLLMFTRYEGFLVVGLVLPLLWIKLSWQQVLLGAAIPLAVTVAWIPAYLHIHGSWGGLSYITEATASQGGFGETDQILSNIDRMLGGAGWKRVWAYPTELFTEYEIPEALRRLVASANWWIGVLAIMGMVWLVVVGRAASLPLITAGTGYTLLLAWWWVYSRYVAPLSALFYFTAAIGASAVFSLVIAVGKRTGRTMVAAVAYVALAAALISFLYQEAPRLHQRSLGNAWDGNRKGYAHYRAITDFYYHGPAGERVLFVNDQAIATLFFGFHDQPKSSINPGRGLYLTSLPDKTPVELYELLRREDVRHIIEIPGDKRLPSLLVLLREQGNLSQTQVYREVRWDDGEAETVPHHMLVW